MDSKYDDDDDDMYETKQDEGKYQEQKEIDADGYEKIKSNRISDKELLDRVQQYFYGDDEFTKIFEDFVDRKCGIIDLLSEEYKLEYTEVYDEFKDLLERTLERFITQQGCTIHDFYNALRVKQETDPDGSVAIFGQILITVTDFDIFMTMMRERAKAKSHK